MDTETLALENGEYTIIERNNTRLLIFKNSKIYRWSKCGYWKYVNNTANSNTGYNVIGVGSKANNNLLLLLRHRLMGYAFLNLDIENSKIQIDHIDGNKLNNHIDNLRIVNSQQNAWNKTKTRGYIKRKTKYEAYIGVDHKLKMLGYFNTEEEAHQAYLNAKKIYHII